MSPARALDQFYTKANVATRCLAFLRKHAPTNGAFFLEPSAGSGAFFSQLPQEARMGLDLDPKAEGIVAGDFFKFDPAVLPHANRIIVVGNPPFGKNSSLALRFLNEAAGFADFIAFVLPQTFKKRSLLGRIHPNLHLVAQLDMEPYSFEFEGEAYDVPCVFQVWERRAAAREIVDSPLSHPDFSFSTPSDADFAVRRVGGLAGKVILDYAAYSPSSHYYIKAKDPERCLEVFKQICWDEVKYQTAGNPSVSKRELVELYTKAINRSSSQRLAA